MKGHKRKFNVIQSVIIEIRPTTMAMGGIGLFACRALEMKTIIAHADLLGEEFHPWSEYDALDEITQNKCKAYCLQTPDGFYAPSDFNYLTVPWNMNHSCDYNVGFDDYGNFTTTREVEANEELVWDYGMGISDPKFRLECACGSEKCRKLITGDDWKNEYFFENNKKFFMRELLALRGCNN
jgi:uncharacterized protein